MEMLWVTGCLRLREPDSSAVTPGMRISMELSSSTGMSVELSVAI